MAINITYTAGKGGSISKVGVARGFTPTEGELYNALKGAFNLRGGDVPIQNDKFMKKAGAIIKDEVLRNYQKRRGPFGPWKPPSQPRMTRRRYVRAWTGEKTVPISAVSPYTKGVVRNIKNAEIRVSESGVNVNFTSNARYRDLMWRTNMDRVDDEITAGHNFIALGSKLITPKKATKLIIPAENNEKAHAFITGTGEYIAKSKDPDYSNSYPIRFASSAEGAGNTLHPRPFVWVSDSMKEKLNALFRSGKTNIRGSRM